MISSPGLVTVILFLLGKQNSCKNLDPFFCYINKNFKRDFYPRDLCPRSQRTLLFSPRTNPWWLSEPDGWPSDPFGRGYLDCELYLFSHHVPHSFLVCPVSWRRSSAPPESHEDQRQENQQRFWSHIQCKNHLLPLGESLSPGVRLGCVLLCSGWHSNGNCMGSWAQTLSSDRAWMHCGSNRACGCLSLSLWLIQKKYKWLKHKKRIFPIPNSLTSKTENSLTPIVPFAGSK